MYFLRVGESFQLFLWFPNSLFFPSEPSLNFLCSDHLKLRMRKSKYVLIFVWFFCSSSLYQLLCLVHSLQVPGIPLAAGKQQDCLLYLVTIATGLECEAIMVALYCVEGRPMAYTVLLSMWLPEIWHVSGDLCSLTIALIALHSWVKLYSGTVIYWEHHCFLLECRWMTHLDIASKAQGKR